MKKVRNTLLASGKEVSVSKPCRWLSLSRSTAYYQPRQRRARPIDEVLAGKIKKLHEAEPSCGVRGTWSRLRFRDGILVNRKKVHRIMKLKGWTLPKRRAGNRPRVQTNRSVTSVPDHRWATDIALVHCGQDGWCAFVPVIDCCSREVLGHALETTARAKTAERALEEALLARFGALGQTPKGLILRHDNGLVFGSRQFRQIVSEYGIVQEYITPYTPQQNGLCERFIRTFKEELCWNRRFGSLDEAKAAVHQWLLQYNEKRPHQSLNYQTPTQYYQSWKLAA